MYCCELLCVHSSLAIVLMGKRELVAFLSLSSWCLVIVVWLFLAVPRLCLQFVIVVFPDHTHFLFLSCLGNHYNVVKWQWSTFTQLYETKQSYSTNTHQRLTSRQSNYDNISAKIGIFSGFCSDWGFLYDIFYLFDCVC